MSETVMEPVVLIDKKRNKEAHIIIPVNSTFEDLVDTARRINTGLFEGKWQLSYMDNASQGTIPINQDTEIEEFLNRDITTFYWNYKVPAYKSAFQKRNKPLKKTAPPQSVNKRQRKERQVLGLEYANIWNRFGAWMIDMVVIFILGSILLPISQAAFSIVFILYFTLMEGSKHQGSLGKIALRLRVTDMRGNPINTGNAFVRSLLKGLAHAVIFSPGLFTTLLGLAVLYYFFNTKHQTIYDQWAKTLVLAEVDQKTRA